MSSEENENLIIPTGSKKRDKRPRKDAITEVEKTIYTRAVQNKGNNWKEIVSFFVQHQDILPPAVAKKYVDGQNGQGVQSVRNRLGNIGRQVRFNPDVKAREERHVIQEQHQTTESLITSLRKVKEVEEKDPLNNNSSDKDESSKESDFYENVAGTSGFNVRDDDDLSSNSLSEEEKSTKSRKSKSKKSTKKGKKNVKRLHAKAEQLMKVGLETAKLHMKFLQKSAENLGIELSDSEATE